jgi:hypothetical protein
MTGTRTVAAAQVRLGALALVSLVAGSLPWIMWGSLVTRALGIPFLLLGLFCAYATYRLPAVAAEAARRNAVASYPAEPVAGCACGSEGGCCGGQPSAQAGESQTTSEQSPVDSDAKSSSDSVTVDSSAQR